MASFQMKAIVIGIEKYPSIRAGIASAADVPGAVADAIAFYQWLIDDEGLPPSEIALHLGPTTSHPNAQPARRDEIVDSLMAMRQSGPTQGRLFFFFSGHGFSFQQNFGGMLEDVLVLENFKGPENLGPTLRAFSIVEWLRPMGPCEQYFFFDCCRNSLAGAALSGGEVGLNAPFDPTVGESTQMALFAARPGETTVAPSPFTNLLLHSLRGRGSARTWRKGNLVVTFDSLVHAMGEKLTPPPFKWGRGTSEGLLKAVYLRGQGAPPKETCVLRVVGIEAGDVCQATASLEDMVVASVPLNNGEGTLELTPRTYTVEVLPPTVAGSALYKVEPTALMVDLFEPRKVDLNAVVLSLPGGRVRPSNGDTNSTSGISPDSFEDGLVTPPRVGQQVFMVGVTIQLPSGTSADVVDADGEVRERSEPGKTSFFARLLPGRYTARLWQEGIVVVTSRLDVFPDKPETIQLSPPAATGIRAALTGVTGGRAFVPSEQLGPIWDQRLPLWLAMLAVKAASGDGTRVFPTGVFGPEIVGTAQVFLVIAAPDLPNAHLWTPAGKVAVDMEPSTGVPGLYFGIASIPIGTFAAAWESSMGRSTVIACTLERRVTVITAVQLPNEQPSIQVFLPLSRAFSTAESSETELIQPPAALARELVNAEEAYVSAWPILPLRSASLDPIYHTLTMRAAMRAADLPTAQREAARLHAVWPKLPDMVFVNALLAKSTPTMVPTLAEHFRIAAALGTDFDFRSLWGSSSTFSTEEVASRLSLHCAWASWSDWILG
ncbi:MAG: caspase family protein [Polyangiaceae bacterium]|nr:caspase family protein [Polyangiaceae bacterium]